MERFSCLRFSVALVFCGLLKSLSLVISLLFTVTSSHLFSLLAQVKKDMKLYQLQCWHIIGNYIQNDKISMKGCIRASTPRQIYTLCEQ